ncbi:hypothetical protein ABW20_dc0109933 [Dactylellina cionopaga]|nr:hypothetical protein ABW20_dc0109933 [Dactylellina cionopaga]
MTATVTVDGTSTSTPTGTIPEYASACTASVRYSSACYCVGVTASTSTVNAGPTATPSFVLQFVDGKPGEYIASGFQGDAKAAVYTSSIDDALRFTLSDAGILQIQDGTVITTGHTPDSLSYIYLDIYGPYAELTCSIAEDTSILSCDSAGFVNFGIQEGEPLLLGTPDVVWSDYGLVGPVTIKAVWV